MQKLLIINNRKIDPETGEIKTDQETITLEPKAMQVLMLLVNRRGNMVSQEQIFSQVWPSSIFNPSSIQRCIAILRKALGDDAKRQQIIKTHPKRGYSLHADVNDCVSQSFNVSYKHAIFLGCLIILLTVALATWSQLTRRPKLNTNSTVLQPLSYSEDNEYMPKMSPSADSISYLKSTDKGTELWLRDSLNSSHRQIYSSGNQIVSYTWSSDSQTIFIAEMANQLQQPQYQLKRLRIPDSHEQGHFEAKVQLLWTFNDLIYLANLYHDNRNQLLFLGQTYSNQAAQIHILNLVTGKTEQLNPLPNEFHIDSFSLFREGALAIIGRDSLSNNHIFVFDPISNKLALLSSLGTGYLEVSWKPNSQILLLNDGKTLKLLSDNGRISPINFSTLATVHDVHFAPNDQILFTLERTDTDIVHLSLDSAHQKTAPKPLINSNQSDRKARLSPSGKQIAFVSTRNGIPQVFIYNQQQELLVYRNLNNVTQIGQPLWLNEEELLLNLDGKLIAINLDSHAKHPINLTENVLQLLTSESGSMSILLTYKKQGQLWLGKFNLQSQILKPLLQLQPQQFAHHLPDNSLVVIEQNSLVQRTPSGQFQFTVGTESNVIVMSVQIGKNVYVQTQNKTKNELWHFHSQLRTLTKVVDLAKHLSLADISHDQKSVILDQTTQEQDIVALKVKLD